MLLCYSMSAPSSAATFFFRLLALGSLTLNERFEEDPELYFTEKVRLVELQEIIRIGVTYSVVNKYFFAIGDDGYFSPSLVWPRG